MPAAEFHIRRLGEARFHACISLLFVDVRPKHSRLRFSLELGPPRLARRPDAARDSWKEQKATHMSGRDVASVTQDALLGDRECCGSSGTVPCFAHVTAERVRQHGGGPLAMTGPGREPRALSFRRLSAERAYGRGEYRSASGWYSGDADGSYTGNGSGALLRQAGPAQCGRAVGCSIIREAHTPGPSPGGSGSAPHGSYCSGPGELPAGSSGVAAPCDEPNVRNPSIKTAGGN